MRIDHVALYTGDIDVMVNFYKKYFGAVEQSRYTKDRTGMQICTIVFDKGAKLEVMTSPGHTHRPQDRDTGYVHIAMNAGGQMEVDFLTQRMKDDGCRVISEPRLTGDGYYQSLVADPDGNWIEINN